MGSTHRKLKVSVTALSRAVANISYRNLQFARHSGINNLIREQSLQRPHQSRWAHHLSIKQDGFMEDHTLIYHEFPTG